jgi:hypothetical protein
MHSVQESQIYFALRMGSYRQEFLFHLHEDKDLPAMLGHAIVALITQTYPGSIN